MTLSRWLSHEIVSVPLHYIKSLRNLWYKIIIIYMEMEMHNVIKFIKIKIHKIHKSSSLGFKRDNTKWNRPWWSNRKNKIIWGLFESLAVLYTKTGTGLSWLIDSDRTIIIILRQSQDSHSTIARLSHNELSHDCHPIVAKTVIQLSHEWRLSHDCHLAIAGLFHTIFL